MKISFGRVIFFVVASIILAIVLYGLNQKRIYDNYFDEALSDFSKLEEFVNYHGMENIKSNFDLELKQRHLLIKLAGQKQRMLLMRTDVTTAVIFGLLSIDDNVKYKFEKIEGMVSALEEDWAEAVRHLDKVEIYRSVKQCLQDADFMYYYTLSLIELGDISAADFYVKKYKSLFPEDCRAHYIQAKYQAQDNYSKDKIRDHLEKALNLCPGNGRIVRFASSIDL